MDLRTSIGRITSPLIDFIYPPTCIACTKLLTDGSQKVCSDCWNAIPKVSKDLPLYQQTRLKLLSDDRISELISCFVFEINGPFQHIAHALKYKEYKSLGMELGIALGETVGRWNTDIDLIIPVPLHPIKQRERGYNQSEFIARGVASVLRKPVIPDAVHRSRNTQTQTQLNFEERRKNMERAFEPAIRSSNTLLGKKCLLVDDVITTGATTNACARAIRSGGASNIIAASAALAA